MGKTSRDLTWIIFFLFLVFMLMPLTSFATVPQTINYQGYLTSSSGTPVNGTVSIVFSLYNVQSGGTALWTETHANLNVTNGVYSVVLGNGNPTPVPINLAFDAQYYLGVTVGTDSEMAPRQALTTVPTAFRAVQADNVSTSASISTQNQIVSTLSDGTAPLSVASTTVVPNLNADTVDGNHAADFVDLSTTQTIGGAKTFSSQIVSNVSTGTAPFQVASTTTAANLNADLLDGQHASDIISTASIEGNACNDGDLCTENDKYVNGQCAGTPKNCDDGLNFTIDSCNPGTGQCTYTTVLCQGQNCDDGNLCTNDRCDVSGCTHTPNSYSTSCYTGPGGTFGIGNCSSGTKTCSGGFFGACVGQILPASEACGGGDENCDGFLNEENAVGCTFYRKDVDGDGYGINDTKCLCAPGKMHDGDSTTYKYYTAANTGTYECNDSNHHINPGATEVCNNVIDDNCSGQTDENCTISADTVDGKNASDLKILLAASSSTSATTISAACTNHQGGEVTINVTGAGTIIADANAWVQIDHTTGIKDIAYIAIGTTTTDCGANENKGVINMPLAYPTTTLDNSVHVSKSLHVTSSGNYTFYLNGLMYSGQNSGDQFYYSNMRAVFYPD